LQSCCPPSVTSPSMVSPKNLLIISSKREKCEMPSMAQSGMTRPWMTLPLQASSTCTLTRMICRALWPSATRQQQEWFAAYHLSLLPEAEQAAFWRKNCHNPKFAVVLKFFSGLTKLKSPVVSEAILPTSGGGLPSKCDTDNPYLLYVFHALFESQNESLTQSIATQLNGHLTFDLYLTPFDTMAISHCLTKCKHLTELDMIEYILSPTSFHHVCSAVRCNPLLQSLSLRVDQFSIKGE